MFLKKKQFAIFLVEALFAEIIKASLKEIKKNFSQKN